MTNLPPLDPTIAAEALSKLPPRLLKRAEKLAAESDSWKIHPNKDGLTIILGQASVTLLDDALQCDCLLSPKCAHIGAVCVASPVGEATVSETPNKPSDIKEKPPTQNNGAAWAKELPPPAQIGQVVENARTIVEDIIRVGLGQLSIQTHTQLLACVQSARVCGLPRLERALTGLATHSQIMRMGKPIGRMAATRTVFHVALLCHLLDRDPTDRAAIGQSRRAYTTLDAESGVGAGRFIPLFAEPIITASGYAGVNVVLATAQGDVFAVTKTPPGGIPDVKTVWHGAIRLGDLHCSHAQLAQKVLMITGGKASADGRIGAGKGVRAALGKTVTLEMIRQIPMSGEFTLIDGEITDITLKHLTIATTPEQPSTTLEFLDAARKTALPSLVEACQRYISNDHQIQCTVLVRNTTVLSIWSAIKEFELPEEYSGRIFPGLDEVPVPTLENKYSLNEAENNSEISAHRKVSEIIDPWLARIVFGGVQDIRRRLSQIQYDGQILENIGAPFAAKLLNQMGSNAGQMQPALALALYSQNN